MAKAAKGVSFGPKLSRDATRLLTPGAMNFITALHRTSADAIAALADVPAAEGERPETASIRLGDWKVRPVPRELQDMRTAVAVATGRRELLLGLNSGARLCIADFHDALPPLWDLLIDGQLALIERWTSAMEHADHATGQRMSLSQRAATLMVRPRPLTLPETRVKVDGGAVPAGIFDAGLYLFHCAATAIAKASGPYLCIPGIASAASARCWNDVLIHAQSLLGLPAGSIRVMAMIEEPGAAYDLDAILFELRDHAVAIGLGTARYAASLAGLTAAGARKPVILAADCDATDSLMAYLIRVAHRRSCLALAPMRGLTAAGLVRAGFDGILLHQPKQAMALGKAIADDLPTANQLYALNDHVTLDLAEFRALAGTRRSAEDCRADVLAILLFIEEQLSGRTAEAGEDNCASVILDLTRLWQWARAGVRFDGSAKAGEALFEDMLAASLAEARKRHGDGRHREAAAMLRSLVSAKDEPPDLIAALMRKLA